MGTIEAGIAPSGVAPQLRLDRATTTVRTVIGGLNQRRLLVWVIFLVIFAFDFGRPTDIDLWWHLKTGELIAQTGTVPVVDPFSYTAVGRPWVAHEWLWELGLFTVNQLGGYRLAVVASALIVTLTFVLLYRLLRQLGVNELVSTAVVLWAAALAILSIGVRPREVTFLFLAFYLSQLWLYRLGTVGHLWSLPVVMAVWVNVHGAFILGLGLFALFGAGEVLSWLFARGRPPRHLALVGLATFAVTALNPQGPKMLLYPVGYFFGSDNPSFATVTEFQSPSFHEPIYLLFAAGLLLLMVLGVSRDRFGVGNTLPVVVFALLALVSARNVPDFALVAAPVLATQLRARFGWARELLPVRTTGCKVALNWILLVSLVGMGIWYTRSAIGAQRLQLGLIPQTESLPVAGVQFIEQQHLPGPIFNNQPWGGYLIDRWYPDPGRRVFIDGRVDLYGKTIVDDYREVVTIRPGWRKTLDRYGVQTVLIDKDSPLSTLLLADGGWVRVFQGEVEDVFVRRPPQ
jgi:hypothetical protein